MCVGSWGFFPSLFFTAFSHQLFYDHRVIWVGRDPWMPSDLSSAQIRWLRQGLHVPWLNQGRKLWRWSALPPMVSNTSSCSRFCYSPGVMGWHMTAGERPSSNLPSSYPAGQAALQKAACFAAGIWGNGSVGVKDVYHVRETVISSLWVLFLSPSCHCHFP